jgi:hypothetical protein
LEILPVAIDLRLVPIDLLLLLVLRIFMSLQLVADQRTSAQTEGTADKSTGCRMVYRCANNAAGGSAAESADTRALLSGTERAAGTSGQ